MRGKTNILPMVGGYVNAPVGNFVAGERLQLGDLVEKSYSDNPQQLQGTTPQNSQSNDLFKMYDGKYIVPLEISSRNVRIAVIEKSAEQFVSNEVNLFTFDSGYQTYYSIFVPINDRTFIIFAEAYSSSIPSIFYCKKVTYNGVDFSAQEIVCNTHPDFYYRAYWGNYYAVSDDGTLFVTADGKVYYVTLENNEAHLIGGQTISTTLSYDLRVIYLPTQDLFLVFKGGNYYIVTIDNVNDTLSISSGYASVVDKSVAKFKNGLVSADVYGSTLYYSTVDEQGIITVEDTYNAGNSYNLTTIIPFENFFILCGVKRTQGSNWTYFTFYYTVYYYDNGFIVGDTASFQSSQYGSSVYHTGGSPIGYAYDTKGIIAACAMGSYGTYSILAYQQMLGDEFATSENNFVMVKAQHHIQGVVKSGGNTGDTVQVFVPQISS